MADIKLVPLGIMTFQLGETFTVGDGPKGTRMVADVPTGQFRGERISAELATNDAADWLTISEGGKLGALDVRATFKTDDGALIYTEYAGRMDMEAGLIASAPTFQTGSSKYSWLNRIQAVAAGAVNMETGALEYTVYEAKVTP